MAAEMLATRAIAMCSAAPAEDLSTMAVSPALRRLGITTPWAPTHSAERMMAPRLCGSLISSQTTTKLAPVGLDHDDALVPRLGGDMAESLVDVAPGDEDLVDGAARAESLDHGVAALNELIFKLLAEGFLFFFQLFSLHP